MKFSIVFDDNGTILAASAGDEKANGHFTVERGESLMQGLVALR